jgi:hypothetical protein
MRAAGRRAPPAFFLALAFAIIWSSAARAKTTTIDDSGTQALEPSVALRWKTPAPSRSGANNLMIGTTTIRVRLNVAPWLRHSGRIYLNLPAQMPGPIAASWITQGRFLPGEVHSGNRMLLYAGPISTPILEDVLKVQFSVDGALIRRAFPVTFRFEMEEN